MNQKVQPLPVDKLKRRCDPEHLRELLEAVDSSDESIPLGQKSAVEALEFGLDIRAKGYNLFVIGPPGSGKTNTTLKLIRARAKGEPRAKDICYLYNFKDPDQPIAVLLPPGRGAELQRQVRQQISALSRSIYQILHDEFFLNRTSSVSAEAQSKRGELLEQLSRIAEKYQLQLEYEEEQFLVVPLKDGEPIETDAYELLSPEEQEEIQAKVRAFQNEAAPLLAEQQILEQTIEENIARMEREAIEGIVSTTVETLKENFSSDHPQLEGFFSDMFSYIMENYRTLLQLGAKEDGESSGGGQVPSGDDNLPVPFRVNILVSHRESGAPVEVEKEPTLNHLFGYIEYQEGPFGPDTDHTMFRPGSLHRANGGYLLIQAADLIRSPETWNKFKRALRHREIRLQDPAHDPEKPRIYGKIRPQAVPLDLKVILIGSAELYYQIINEDEDFERIFKVKVEFDSWIPRTSELERDYCLFIRRLAQEEGLLEPDYTAMAEMIEYSSREIESQERLSTSVVSTLDLLCEADYWARRAGRSKIHRDDIRKALYYRETRNNKIERDIAELIDKGEILIDTDSWAVGQINALLVYASKDHIFGVPNKITARVYSGDKGVINIDREAQLSGAIHDKGSMILVGLLGSLWGQEYPLYFNASITFEQLYGEVEGDSASCAEFYALISCLADIPIYQGIAVTGSLNQLGQVQPIGEVNVKIEGFFQICKRRGLTGRQGVIIPEKNVSHLMLKDEVLEAVEKGLFHIWPIENIEQGIEILMGKPAGRLSPDGKSWEKGSVFEAVQKRVEQFYQRYLSSQRQ